MITTLLFAAAAQTGHVGGPTNPELTVYNQGFGLVKELRNLRLKDGAQTIQITDVPSMIDPTSVAIRSITAPGSFEVLEQNYQYDLVNVQSILNKAVGSRVKLIRHFGDKEEVLEGTLISSPTAMVYTDQSNGFGGFGPSGYGQGSGSSMQYNGMVIKLDSGGLLLNPVGEVEVSSLPEGMVSRPTLLWNLMSQKSGDNLVELSYIANGMRWEANYVFTLNEDSGTGALQGWVTVNNDSGSTYPNAKLKLLAGDVHTVQQNNRGAMMRYASGGFGGGGAAGNFQEQSLFEYHLYTLQHPSTIKNKEMKQISLLESDKVPFRKRLVIDSLRDFGVYYPSEGEIGGGNIKPQIRVEFVNDEAAGLGIPLPAGKVRLYQRDNSGSVQLLGEDKIEHTPRHEKLSLVVGASFDIVANRKRLSFRWDPGPTTAREEFQIEVRNRKSVAATVEVLERHYGDWDVPQSSEPFTKEDANTMRYVLNLKPDEVRKITYTVVTHW